MNSEYAPKKMDLHTAICLSYSSIPEEARSESGAKPSSLNRAIDAVMVSGVENTAYYYSTYNAPDNVPTSDRKKIMILGGGPNRIGQGIEFDYCCVHAAFALRERALKQ